jgi:glycosyltransferase involved in cell wall biosynthesis
VAGHNPRRAGAASAVRRSTSSVDRRPAIIVTTFRGAPTVEQLKRDAADGKRPRKDYVELADLLGADVLDWRFMHTRATRTARTFSKISLEAGQVVEAFVQRTRRSHTVVWSDRLGLPLAALFKLSRGDRKVDLISAFVTNWKKAPLLKHLKVHSHLSSIVGQREQMRLAVERLRVPEEKVFIEPWSVDEHFWKPLDVPRENMLCAPGLEARDYATLLQAVSDVNVRVEITGGSVARAFRSLRRTARELGIEAPPPSVRISHREFLDLRELYARSAFAVVPVKDVEYGAGITALTEAMAMGKAVIATRTRAHRDLFQDGREGIFVPAEDPLALRHAVESLLNEPAAAARMGAAGRELVEKRHSLDVRMRRLAAIVREPAAARL